MAADGLATLGARATAGMVLTPKQNIMSPSSEALTLWGLNKMAET